MTLAQEVQSINWFHSIPLPGGLVTPGADDTIFKLPKIHLPESLVGKTVIDIGAWNGAFSFECEKRGAKRVLATDWYCWQLGSKKGFDIAKRALGSKVEERELKVEELSAKELGTFDLVLFLGVLYHSPDPIGYLRKARELTAPGGMCIMETLVDAMDCKRPALAYYEGASENGDESNFFGPNQLACEAMLRDVGFSKVKMVDEFYGNRMVFHAFA